MIYKYIGELPKGGEWQFLLISIETSYDVIVVMDISGRHSPRMIDGNGKLIEL